MPSPAVVTATERRERGFTLVELLVVVIIVGILTAVAIPVYLNQRKKAVDASMRADIKNAVLAQETWIADNPGSPGTQAVADFNALGFTASRGTTVMVALYAARGGYCFLAYNPNSSRYNDIGYALLGYDSTEGGFLSYVVARSTGGTGTFPTTGSCGGGRSAVTYIS